MSPPITLRVNSPGGVLKILQNCTMLTNLIVKNENSNGVTGLCLQARDLAISKYVAGRLKGLQFTGELARLKMIDRSMLTQRLKKTDLSRSERSRIRSRIEANFGSDQRVKNVHLPSCGKIGLGIRRQTCVSCLPGTVRYQLS